jgi:CheY-like chemotaxis protein
MTQVSPLLLVIDDDEDIRDVLRVLLEGDGYRVTTAGDGLEAWQELKTNERPSLIILDWMMPRMDGEGFMNTLRSSPFADIPVVIMSGQKEATNKDKELRGNLCLLKPVELDDLLSAVHRFAKNDPRQAA